MPQTAVLDNATQQQTLVGPNQKYWDLGLKLFQAQEDATQAIQDIWDAMSPPASLPLLATIVGSLYADTYWATTKLDVNLLAANLQAALGLNFPDCLRAATIAFSKWYGLLVRSNFGDSGGIPKPDPVTASPDVVVNGAAKISVRQLITQWNVDIYTPQPGLKNNTYGRAQSVNIQVPITQPKLRMYFSDAGFNPPPTSWVKMFTSDGSETAALETLNPKQPVGVGERAANGDPFGFNPPGSGHFCLISVVGSEFFTNNPSDTPGNWNTQEWVHFNGAAGWHNVDVQKSVEASLKFYNQDGVPERFIFEAHCDRLPAGTVVSLESDDAGLQHPIRTGPVTINRKRQVVSTEAELPPNFAGNLKVRIETPDGKIIPAGSSVDVRMDWHLSNGHRHYAQAVDQLGETHALLRGLPVRIPMGNYTFVGPEK